MKKRMAKRKRRRREAKRSGDADVRVREKFARNAAEVSSKRKPYATTCSTSTTSCWKWSHVTSWNTSKSTCALLVATDTRPTSVCGFTWSRFTAKRSPIDWPWPRNAFPATFVGGVTPGRICYNVTNSPLTIFPSKNTFRKIRANTFVTSVTSDWRI